MERDKIYLIGDYINYLGDNCKLSEPLRSPDIGKIEKFEKFNGIERVYLFLLNKQEHIWCDYFQIRPKYTNINLMKKLGFTESINNNFKRYQLNDICISECAIKIGNNYLFCSGYCATDFTNGIPQIEKYINNNDFDDKAFRKDFNYVQNANDLFKYLREKNLKFDAEKILL